MLSSSTTRYLHKRIKINTLLVRTATPIFLAIMENRLALVIYAATLHVLLGLVPLVASLTQTLCLTIYSFIPSLSLLTLHGNRLGFAGKRLLQRTHGRGSIWILLVVLLNRFHNRSNNSSSSAWSAWSACSACSACGADSSVNGCYSGGGGVHHGLLFTRVRTDRTAGNLVKLIPIIYTPITLDRLMKWAIFKISKKRTSDSKTSLSSCHGIQEELHGSGKQLDHSPQAYTTDNNRSLYNAPCQCDLPPPSLVWQEGSPSGTWSFPCFQPHPQ